MESRFAFEFELITNKSQQVKQIHVRRSIETKLYLLPLWEKFDMPTKPGLIFYANSLVSFQRASLLNQQQSYWQIRLAHLLEHNKESK